MMNDELKKAIRTLTNSDDEVYSIVGKVTKVDKSRKVVNVEPLNGDAEIFGVRLQSNESDTEGVVIYPKKGSNVTVTFLNKDTGYVAQFSEMDGIKWKFKNLKGEVNSEGLHLENNGADLKKVVDSIIDNTDKIYDFLIGLKIIIPTGIGKLSPDMIVQVKAEQIKLTALKNQLDQLLK